MTTVVMLTPGRGAISLYVPERTGNTRLAWQDDALCAQTDPELFTPEKGASNTEAKKVCAACTVREQCLAWALDNDPGTGVWGGKSERERRRIKKETAA